VSQIPLSGANSIVGRAVVVHELQDDLGKGDHSQPGTQGKTSKTTGNAGAPLPRLLRCAPMLTPLHPPQARAWPAA
jgi:Cu/Zn superoxide dismutase